MNATSNVQDINFQFFRYFSQFTYKRHIEEIIIYSMNNYYIPSFEESIISLLTIIILYQQFYYGRRLQKLENMLEDDEDSFNKKLKTLQDNLDQKFKIINKKLSNLNKKYSSLKIKPYGASSDEDSNTYDDDSNESDYEQEKELDEKRTYGSIRIQNYNDKSFAVFGDTKEFKDILKQLGGKWNRKLSGGPGWIFANNCRDNVNKWFDGHFN